MTHDRHELLMAQDVEKFIRAGKAIFTLESKRTGKHFTYRIDKGGRNVNDPIWFVKTRFGPDAWGYIGIMDRSLNLSVTRKSQCGTEAPSYMAIHWFLRQLKQGRKPYDIRFMHEGKCCRCGRTLTNPDSIRSGIGPECAGKM